MSRPLKDGLDYFSKDVDYYDDFKIMELLNEFGPLGQTIYDVIVTTVYANGYYLAAPLDQIAFKVIRTIGGKWVKNKQVVLQVIYFCSDIGLFDNGLLQQGIITSAGIQKRYAKATVRRQSKSRKPYWLLDSDGNLLLNAPQNQVSAYNNSVSVDNNPVSVNKNAIKESKVKKSKEEINKEEISVYRNSLQVQPDEIDAVALFEEFWNAYPEHRRQHHANAQRIFLHLLHLDPDVLPKVMQGLKRAKGSEQWQKNSGQFVPCPDKFLMDHRWEDTYTPFQKANTGGNAPSYDLDRLIQRGMSIPEPEKSE
ncbi:hypothetical protein CLOSTMETH_01717 [[Clostridium] methylpentosum DSM 5476]|uniref:Lin1244/Lin1753-like N-terminal domain-containing protein n=1 Tax=[Clostridium] methylpentosum DSM 5476 TaxID=537013 RepID=C0ECZ6_9FIRM|nr:hypothetical protein CLOSTMETH_01717 [[Clostridium] methylpentosum DSM 5476]MDY3990198.1 DUF4373 domain-containing protein [Massilioclostridium sp.]MEE1492708.1 DUF4373 domain-containing protein [Massilioclostridium sp.]